MRCGYQWIAVVLVLAGCGGAPGGPAAVLRADQARSFLTAHPEISILDPAAFLATLPTA